MLNWSKNKLFIFDIVLFVILILALVSHFFELIPFGIDETILIFFAILGTFPIVLSAFYSLKKKKISVDLLASVALIFSILANEWTSAVFISLMITLARILARYTKDRVHNTIKSLLKLRPQKAKVKKDGKLIEVPVNEIKEGDLVVVDLGERVPVDGTVVEGEASVDQSSLTGESIPITKIKGDEVLSSTIVSSGNLVIKAEKIGKDTTFEKIIDLVEKSQKNKAEIQNIADKFASWYIVVVFIGAIIIYLFSKNLHLVLSTLLVTCADDLAVAVPLTFTMAIIFAAERGVIIKGGNYLEGLAKVKTVVVDKTGTLTYGRLKVEGFFTFGKELNQVLYLAGIASFGSNHPATKAIMNYAKEKNVSILQPEKYEEHGGKGTIVLYKNKRIVIGKPSFLQELKVEITDEQLNEINKEKEKGLNVTLISYDNELIGFFTLADELKPNIKEDISELKTLGIEKIVMLSGDNEKVAKKVADIVDVDEFYANLLPEDKLNHFKKYLNNLHNVAMVGDGVNDAPVLSLADISIAMGAIGSDAAIESADITLMKDDFSKIPEIVKLSKYVLKIVREDFIFWAIFNAIGLILVFADLLQPTGAATYNFLTDFIPLLNSVKLFKLYFKKVKI